jgi:uncharacterized membrane protein
MERRLPKKLLIASIATIVLIVILLVVWKYWGKVKFEEFKYPDFYGEVLEWDPGSSIVRVRYDRNGTSLKENLVVDPTVSLVVFMRAETRPNVGGIINGVEVKDKNDVNWEKLFCPGNTLRFIGNRFVMRIVKNDETLEGAHII